MTKTSPTARAAEDQTKTPGHEGQTFLVGDEVYIRGVEESDAVYVMNWRKSLFPVSIARGETIIKEAIPKQGQHKTTLMIVRKVDDVVVGSIVLDRWEPGLMVDVHVNPIFGEAGQRWKAGALSLVVPWLVDEQNRPIVWLDLPADETVALAAAERLGMRRTARLREMLNRDGQRVDRLLHDYPNKEWMANIGDPMAVPLERSGTGEPRPVPMKIAVEGEPPKDAIMVGRRVYLRPLQRSDADEVAWWSRRETETFWDIGRNVRSPVSLGHWIDKLYEDEMPESIFFGVCLRENDELIGAVSLIEVDYLNRFAETGTVIHNPQYRGGGYGSEAKHLLLEYAFDRLGLHMLHSSVFFQNTRSAAALRKQGYREAGRLNWFVSNRGRFENFVLFDLLAEEWRAMPRAECDGA